MSDDETRQGQDATADPVDDERDWDVQGHICYPRTCNHPDHLPDENPTGADTGAIE